jgi:Tol biopolymer transport system component
MSKRNLFFLLFVAIAFLIASGVPKNSLSSGQASNSDLSLIVGRNVNMVSGTKLPLGDPWLQRQNEPSIAVSSRNPMHLFAAANDYRTIDVPDPNEVRGIPGVAAIRDAWIGTFISLNGGESFYTMLLPGFPQDTSNEAQLSPIHGFDTACDPIVRAGANGLLYLSGIAFNRSQKAGSVFVARYVDSNDREKVEEEIDEVSGYKKYVGPINYIGTRIVDAGNPGHFIDMPNMAVDVPRAGAKYGKVYLAYTVFLGNSKIDVRSKVVFRRSTDGGATWSKEIKLTEGQNIIQRPVIVIDPSDPNGKTIYVVFRRFSHGNTPDGIALVKSIDGGLSFSKPADVAPRPSYPFYPFDQLTKGDGTVTSFRTNSYPTMAVDGNGVAYIAWAQRYGQDGVPDPGGQARIVISYLEKGGLTWSEPQWVDPSYEGDGHQFMPSMTCAGGKVTVIWYDERDDIALHHPNTKFIEDVKPEHRHTIDVRAAEAPAVVPLIFDDSILVSRYLFFMQLDENGEPYMEGGYPQLWQGEFNYSCLPLFWLGTKPFHGDYIEIISSPQILPPPATTSNSWKFNNPSVLEPLEPTNFHGVWTDNRNVWPPAGDLWGDWITYNPPTSIQDGDFAQQNPCDKKDTTGMRNQNIYTASLNNGVIVGSPGNTKQLDIPRSFVIFVKDTIGIIGETNNIQNRSFQLRLDGIGNEIASFDQLNDDVKELDIEVPPYSSVSTTVYVNQSTNLFAPVKVNVYEGGTPVGYIILNPDSKNNPILDPGGGDLGDEHHNPKMSNPKIWKYDVGNQNEPNAKFLSPRGQNPRGQNSGYINPRGQNPRGQNYAYVNPRGQNSGAMNPRGQNESFVNSEMYNPRGQNFSVANTALTDMTWTVSNDGNTTSVYSFNIASNNADNINDIFKAGSLIAQVLVYKVHATPIDSECELLQTHADELIVNVTNPRGQNPRGQNYAPSSGNFTTLGMNATTQQDNDSQDITFYLAPGEEAEVTLRVYDPNTTDDIDIDTVIVDQVAGETAAEAANTGQTTPPWVTQPDLPWEETSQLSEIGVSHASLTFEAVLGSNPANQTITVWNSGSGTLIYTISDDAGWLSVLPPSGTSHEPDEGYDGQVHTVSVDITDLTPDNYQGTITISDPYATNNPVRVPVTLTVTGGVAGKIELTGPARVGAGFISEVFTVTSQDGFGNPVNVLQDTEFNLSSNTTGTATFYSDPAGTSRITKVKIPSGQSSANFYYMDNVGGTPTVTTTWRSGGTDLGSDTHQISVKVIVGQIAFTSNRDGNDEIYIMNADGTGVTRLTDNPASDGEVSWSPDGSKIAFTSVRDGNIDIYVMNADGTHETRLTNHTAVDQLPCWSPDGSKITFTSTRDGNYEIYVMNADGTNVTRLTNDPATDYRTSWSPDGSKIAFESDRTENYEIHVMNSDGTGVTRLTDNPASDGEVSWSPDGSKIAFVSTRDGNYEIYVMNADGTNVSRLTNNTAIDWSPSWSPDSSKIVFMSERDGNQEIYIINADGSMQTRITSNEVNDKIPSWGGAKIVYAGWRSPRYQVFIMNANGTGQTRISNNMYSDSGACWSPDGTRIVFSRERNIWVMNSDGTNATQLTSTTSGSDYNPCWSPDGTKIAFASSRSGGGNYKIYTMNADGSAQTLLADILGDGPDWSPDGTKIAFFSPKDNSLNIYVINIDGIGLNKLTNSQQINEAYDFPHWSPDGTKIVFCRYLDRNSDIYVMNANGENIVQLTFDSKSNLPSWCPDGRKIVFSNSSRGYPEVYVMNSDGTNVTRLTSGAYNYVPYWRRR